MLVELQAPNVIIIAPAASRLAHLHGELGLQVNEASANISIPPDEAGQQRITVWFPRHYALSLDPCSTSPT
jgi:hypothetical protein